MYKKYITLFLVVSFVLTTFVFGLLWNKERNDKTEILLLAQAGASDAYTHFSEYRNNGDESSYWYGVSAFRSFQQAYYLLVENTNKVTNYTFCNDVYGNLVLFPERSQTHIAEIVETMELLSKNVEDENGYLLMDSLRDSIQIAEYSYYGTTFVYKGTEYPISGISSIAICIPVGQYIIVESNSGAKNALFSIFNTETCYFEKHIAGSHLIWRDDDITTAIYYCWSDILDYDGNIIGSCTMNESDYISELQFSGNQIRVTIQNDAGISRTEFFDLPVK